MRWLARHRTTFLLFALGLAVYAAMAAERLRRQSRDPHFVLQADAWLRGTLEIDEWPPGADDPARVCEVELKDGTLARGRFVKPDLRNWCGQRRGEFRIQGGRMIDAQEIERHVRTIHYVSFPPFPAVLMIPQAIVHGRYANDVATTVLLAALILPLAFALLRRLAAAGLSARSPREDLWLVAALAFGSVLFFSAVQGRVWFTAHVVGVLLGLGYALCSIEARRPVLAGLFLGLAAVTRTPMAFMFPLFLCEAWRMTGRGDLRGFLGRGLWFAAPVVVIAAAAMIHNAVRFGEPAEFGHIYLAVRQQAQVEAAGTFSLQHLSRNLTVALALLPRLMAEAPYVQISGHGLALWFTTPVLFYLLWPRERGPLHRPLWITVGLVAIPALLYQNSGWIQFGYRFALDYFVFLVMLLAVGGRPLTRLARGLVIAGVIINLFGAITFMRYNQFYLFDARTYSVVIHH